MFDTLDKLIIAALQNDLPLSPQPYQDIAQSLGISEGELLRRLQGYRDSGKIRKLGAVLRHQMVGFSANALSAWRVEPERLQTIGAIMAAEPYITHCYARTPWPDWPYTLYTMLHGHSRAECEAVASDLAVRTGVDDYILLYSTKEWKKTSMRYFCEEAGS